MPWRNSFSFQFQRGANQQRWRGRRQEGEPPWLLRGTKLDKRLATRLLAWSESWRPCVSQFRAGHGHTSFRLFQITSWIINGVSSFESTDIICGREYEVNNYPCCPRSELNGRNWHWCPDRRWWLNEEQLWEIFSLLYFVEMFMARVVCGEEFWLMSLLMYTRLRW